MDFALSNEQEQFRSIVRKYLNSVENTQVARSYAEGNSQPFQNAWKGLSDIGVFAVNVLEEYGGAELGQIDLIPVLEEIGRSLLPGAYPEITGFSTPILKQYGTNEQKEKYLSEIATGVRTVSLAWLEPGHISYQKEDIQMTARREGNQFILSGTKTLVPEGANADTLIVPARTSENVISLFLVDRSEHNLFSKRLENMDETRELAEVVFQDIAVSEQQLLGSLSEGWEILQKGKLFLNAAISAIMVGGMERVVEMSVDYASTRQQFGQPIGRFQAIKHKIAEMKIDLETARSLTYYANWALDHDADDKESAVAGARAFATEAYIRTSGHNVQIHGGIGYTTEIDCHLYVKRARSLENYLGNVQELHEIIAENLEVLVQ